MNSDQLKFIFNSFETGEELTGFSEIKSGHINDTFLIETTLDKKFVLQRINHEVFPDVPGLISNKVIVSQHLLKKVTNNEQKVLQFVPTSEGLFYVLDTYGNYWNLTEYIEPSITFQTVPNEQVAFEGGRVTGEFLRLTSDLNPSDLIEVIPDFHNMAFRFEQFQQALDSASVERIEIASREIRFCKERQEDMLVLKKLKDTGTIPVRVTHNDTKISNILFNRNQQGLAMIDTDTVMPGLIHYDFGDAIRTICATAAEDEKDLSKVQFRMDFYECYKQGFLKGLGEDLTPEERSYLPLAVKTMIFIMGLRFLTDYLNNDIYYKTNYSDHNLVRAKNQFQLLRSFESQLS